MSVTYTVAERIARITFNRPEKHNALRNADVDELIDGIRRFDGDDDADVMILSGAGPSFCAGSDLGERLLPTGDDPLNAFYRPSELDSIFRCVNFKPIVAAVHGYVLGQALGLVMTCDAIVASADTVFQAPEVKYGIPLPTMWAQLARATTPAFATDVVFTGRRFSADEALRAGLLTARAEPGTHIERAETFAATLLGNPQPAVRELVRCRRALLAEAVQHARGVGGVFRWEPPTDLRRSIDG